MKFIYVMDEQLKDKLISKGFHLIKENKTNTMNMWIFENQQKFSFDLEDKNKYVLSNSLTF